MKRLMILGILLSCLIPHLTSCCIDPLGVEIPDTGNPDTVYKTFGSKQTKAQVYFTWENGMNICVYSLDADGKVMFKDTCVVKNASGSGSSSHATIEAEVAREAVTYFACYPFNILDAEVGEVMNYNYKAAGEGKLKNAAILAATTESRASKLTETGSFYFKPQNSILFIGKTIATGAEVAIFNLDMKVYTEDYPDGKDVYIPRSYGYSDSNPYYIHVATHDLKASNMSDSNHSAVVISGKAVYSSGATAWTFKTAGIKELKVGEFKQYVPSKIIQN